MNFKKSTAVVLIGTIALSNLQCIPVYSHEKNVDKIANTLDISNINLNKEVINTGGTNINKGIIREDTTWTKEGSPYRIQGDVQVSPEVTLTIEPGVKIEGNYCQLKTYGNIVAIGNEHEEIEINNMHLQFGNINYDKLPIIKFDKVIMSGGTLFSPIKGPDCGEIYINNSIFKNITEPIYIYNQYKEVHLTGNIFSNCEGLTTGSYYDLYITNNVFYNTKQRYTKATIETWNGYASKTYIEKNTFLDNGIVLKNKSDGRIVGTNNFWNTSDIELIKNKIYDKNVDLTVRNTIDFEPILTKPDGNTPKFSIPTINATDIRIKVGDDFDPLSIVTARDNEDGDLTDKIELIKNTVNTNNAGVYEVTYNVTDSHGASMSKTIKVTVDEKLSVINSIPTISAQDITIKVGDEFNPLMGVSAWDEEDGDLTSKIEIIENTVDALSVGTYQVVYKVCDSQGASAKNTITVTVNPRLSELNNIPQIKAKDLQLKVGDKFDGKLGVSAWDKEDGDLTSKIEIIANMVDTTKVGQYQVIYKVTDSHGASSAKTIVVNVTQKEISDLRVSLSKNTFISNGNTHEPTVTIEGLTEGIDYTVAYKNNIKVGTATVTIKGINNYTGIKTETFTIKLNKTSGVEAKSSSYSSNTVTWLPVYDADGYEVYRATSKTGTYFLRKTVLTGSSLSYKNTSLSTGRTYYYKVKAYKEVNGKKIYGEYSIVSSAKPALSSTTAEASSASYSSNRVTWNKVSGASGYEVYRATSKTGKYYLKKTVASSSTLSYTNTGLTTGKTYYYKVRAYRIVKDKKIYSNYSQVISSKPILSKPSVAITSQSKKVYVKWGKIPGSSGYEVYRASGKTGTYSKVKTVTSGSTTSYINSNLARGKEYYYKVRAYRTVGGNKVYGCYSSVKYIKVK